MSEKSHTYLMANQEEYEYETEAFLRLQKLKRIEFASSPRNLKYARQLTILETALEYSRLAESKEELAASQKIVSDFDPIMWDLIVGHIPSDSYSTYSDLLKRAILTLEDKREEIEEKYDSILSPYEWGGKLQPQYSKYQDFVSKNHSRIALAGFGLLTFVLGVVVLGAFAGSR
ncbi:hypothetical protein PSN45_000820 [Yamadazyma tenuis]|uniref:Uncharacterized protein n=1 Tax=Candida tenuis (strain ATCC 10573 / BCRC 21748 / CBS 615 / JCM 9827 / NBRC 10315 / NRRL Y-1498 / VKM Y-70) TaxID=590646 RepID=G3BAT8_CANTC|nr:uncharacterized protein CANTEDRAFT_115553 [Yamadazyma tenuis ATCC 10573]XP_006688943.1 uncharacterized protein CANTEDRAFT_115553 [Yamadazyma tenuis ATCC 10573]EGV62772.1 hypothetical protein CANTEDRAFT_115553 [Yamadazyma tenuis ATCC 10573]EGV62773.1 hypothetical protein CANTEDRAFT_115553 [Yamadazyma tenuis ATCC 10573]WEJ93357.1 hypothetical protein PSN45_000820 [Yamadazyma tenuis]